MAKQVGTLANVIAFVLLSAAPARSEDWRLRKSALEEYSETFRKRANHVCASAWDSARSERDALRKHVNPSSGGENFIESIARLSTCRATAAAGLAKAYERNKIQAEPLIVAPSAYAMIAPDVSVEVLGPTEAPSSALQNLEHVPWPLPEPSAWWDQGQQGATVGATYDQVHAALVRADVRKPPSICSLPNDAGGFVLVSTIQRYPACAPPPTSAVAPQPEPGTVFLATTGVAMLWTLLLGSLESIVPVAAADRGRIFVFVSTTQGLPPWRKTLSKDEAKVIFNAGALCSPAPSPATRAVVVDKASRLHVFAYEMATKNAYDAARKVSGDVACTAADHQRDLGFPAPVKFNEQIAPTPR